MKDFANNTRRVALLVDGDNLSPRHAQALLDLAAATGQLTVRRVYGKAESLKGWADAAAFSPRLSDIGKNGSDILLCIEAMELVVDARADAFVIASSDRDFGHLSEKLVERGFQVIGAGETKTPHRFRDRCSAFTVLDLPTAAGTEPAPEVLPIDVVIDLLKNHAATDGWMYLSQLAKLYGKTGRDAKATLGTSWAKWTAAQRRLGFDKYRQRVRLV